MNRRSFLSVFAAIVSVVPVAVVSAKASAQFGLRVTVSHPPELGFEYTNGRRYKCFCDGVELERVVRADEPGGRAWTIVHEQQGKGGGPWATREVEHRGQIRLERIA